MSSTLRSFVFIAVYFSGSSAAFSGSLIPQHVTGIATTATPPRPAIDIIGIGPQIVAQSPHGEFTPPPDYATWPPLNAPAWTPSEDSDSFYTFNTVPKEKIPSANPKELFGLPRPQWQGSESGKGQFAGADYRLHDRIAPSPPPENVTPSPESGFNRKLLATGFKSYTPTPVGEISAAENPKDLLGLPRPQWKNPEFQKGKFVGKDYRLHDRIAPSPSPENPIPSPDSGFHRRLLANAPSSKSYTPTPVGEISSEDPKNLFGLPRPEWRDPNSHEDQFIGPDYRLHHRIVPSASPEDLAPSPQSGNRKLLANTPDDLTASPQIFGRPGLSSAYAFPAHASPLEKISFGGRPELQQVAEKQATALVHNKRDPISLDNIDSWTKQNEEYLQLSPHDQEEVRTWLQQEYFDSNPTSKMGEKAIAYIWSLHKSTGKNLVWWGNSIINAGKTDEHEFMDLVEIGDTLKFFNKRADFRILAQNDEAIADHLLKVLEYDSQGQPRSHALAIQKLIEVKGRHGVSMYKARVGQLMNKRLRYFDQQDDRSKERVLQNLYFYVGNSRKEAISKATDALKKSPESFKKLLTPERGVSGQADYDRIEAALNSLVKGGFF
ncbi:hypothetical protein Pst134EA_011968 [Puccinia striiformis f. sp. tritici]|uniref:Uncharacterized protein n=1 Tax=Puccinia striiformis f. sp. tritici PST-78 TaxID=1165861 RepID=A0A0L0V3F6_9BASI|nr:hypothetical protein Pst134EA_011968 [Puccinia striiformis f. sp. tritici]KAH9468344.1 hypothetical protein Pst134EA_011968 [Puccinia striiformis f. sp. tritici]KNE93850.1 hypothetical protein PSTG_12763 [Puccinia striiformis f. sp. tritici PST-78]